MKKFVSRYFLLGSAIVMLGSCCTYTEKQSRELSKVSYAVRDAMVAGRFDRADEFSKELVKIVVPPAPEDRVKIEPIK